MVKKIGKYELGKSLGSGTFGKVKYGIDVTDPKRTAYAIKILDRKQIEKENMQEQLKNEIAIMKLLKHENVVRMFEVIQSPQHIYMVLELITGGELFDRICQAKKFDEATARRYFQQLIFGVHYCHSQGVSHRDLKPENLLLDSNDSLKISDFGLSAITNTNEKSKLLQTTCGTPNYVAPEVLREKGYEGKLSDVWSCGVILFVMMAGYLPFDDPTMNGLFVKIERGDYRMPKTFSPGAKHLISRMLITNPSDRISMAQIMEDPWFIQGVSPEKIATAKMYSKIAPPTGDVSNAIQSESKDAEKAQSAEASQELRQDITAFELASRLVMGVLTPLTSKNQVTVRRNTQFICNGDADSVANAIENALKTCNANPSRGKKEKERVIKGYITAGKEAGLLQFVFTIYSTVCKDLTLVELRRARGDTLEFQKFYRRVVGDLKSICPKQPPAIEEDLQDQS